MKTWTPELAAHYAGRATTITTCWKVSRRDGEQFGYTSLDRDVVVQGRLYSATVGIAASAIASSSDLSIQNVEVSGLFQQGLLALGAMTEEDIIAGIWDDARITIFEVNYRDPTMGTSTIQTGTIGQMKTGRLTYTTELRGLMQHLQQSIGRTVTPGCDYDLGDQDCKVDLEPFTVTGAVTGLLGGSNRRGFVDTSLAKPDHWFAYGTITWLSGANAGGRMEIKDSLGTGAAGNSIAVTLQSSMAYPIAIGDTYSMHAGCNHLNKSGSIVVPISGVVYHFFLPNNFTAEGFDLPSGFFAGGTLTWASGENLGQTGNVSVYEQAGAYGSFSLSFPPSFPVNVGDRFTVIAEQAHAETFATAYLGDCKVKFNNVINKGGFDEVPGNDRVLGAAN